jgi:EAL domain-containing protein (putative c-di-GMP-specific phosphodiesterase class I)
VIEMLEGVPQFGRSGSRVRAVLEAGGPEIVYQPISALPDQGTVGFEAFARFPTGEGPSTPDLWFAEAERIGLGRDLELAAMRGALAALDWLDPHLRVATNASPAALRLPSVIGVVCEHDPRRVIIEITEHEHVPDYGQLRRDCERLRGLGCTIAVDDLGAGYAALQHLVEIRPDIIKLDHAITHDLDKDPTRAAMARALVGFAEEIGATVLAEGIETAAELAAANRLGIRYAQGYYIGRPGPLPQCPHVLDVIDLVR